MESRRDFLKRLGRLGAAGALGMEALAGCGGGEPSPPPVRGKGIQHIIVSCQENRSFDHYFGFAPFAGDYGPPSGFTQPGHNNTRIAPYHLTTLTPADIRHDWSAMHRQWNHGAMDGFYQVGGLPALGYFLEADLPYYYSLFKDFTLCVNSFSSMLGPTMPNRLYLASATSGGQTTNHISPGSLDYPTILDLLDQYRVTWKVYHFGTTSVVGENLNQFQLFARWKDEPRATKFTTDDYLHDLTAHTLPQVAFLVVGVGYSEHPPTNVQLGMGLQQKFIQALQKSVYWPLSVYLLTYDESGGYFDHVPPPQLDAYGAGFRVPTWVISPYAKPAHLEPTFYEHSSILKFIETVFKLPTLASINHRFDTETPAPGNEAAQGGVGPPAPPRDGLASIGNLMECLTGI